MLSPYYIFDVTIHAVYLIICISLAVQCRPVLRRKPEDYQIAYFSLFMGLLCAITSYTLTIVFDVIYNFGIYLAASTLAAWARVSIYAALVTYLNEIFENSGRGKRIYHLAFQSTLISSILVLYIIYNGVDAHSTIQFNKKKQVDLSDPKLGLNGDEAIIPAIQVFNGLSVLDIFATAITTFKALEEGPYLRSVCCAWF